MYHTLGQLLVLGLLAVFILICALIVIQVVKGIIQILYEIIDLIKYLIKAIVGR